MLFSAIQQFPVYTALNSHYCTPYLYVIFSHQKFPLYTALNSHYCTPHPYVIFSHSTFPSLYCTKRPLLHTTSVCYLQPFNRSLYVLHLTVTSAHHICMLFSAIQHFPVYTSLNSQYCTPHLYVIFSHSTFPSIYCT